MALDEAIWQNMSFSDFPTVRFYKFKPVTITIGRLQKINDINLENCKNIGVDVVRRPTGGRAVLHSGDITFSIIAKESDKVFGGSVLETYAKISKVMSETFKRLGVNTELAGKTGNYTRIASCFGSTTRFELMCRGKKILGSAQARENGIILQQGTIPVWKSNLDINLFFTGENYSIEELTDAKISFDEFIKNFVNTIRDLYEVKIEFSEPDKHELSLTNKLIKKYSSKDWLYAK